ncbi:hypothetical protein [Brevibacterium aurantiacum]|uniref:hypothetical protein n=1 Tax=Brevibacterium aurantiacum TaxID=273384 RepID=UPI001868FB7F|nr:hypothetical protein [Brevibacterium aurantiacum]
MAPSVVVTAMTSSMPVNDLRGQGDWITPSQVTELALAPDPDSLDAFAADMCEPVPTVKRPRSLRQPPGGKVDPTAARSV